MPTKNAQVLLVNHTRKKALAAPVNPITLEDLGEIAEEFAYRNKRGHKMDLLQKGWFTEFSPDDLEAIKNEVSGIKDVLVFKSRTYGNVLVLDGIIQCTERDELFYQEMLTHLPMFAHPNPKKVLIVGGGDEMTMCEIDAMVIEVSKKFLPYMAAHFLHPKLNLVIGDGFKFLAEHKGEYDVIITDSSDSIGPAESLFGKSYYALLNDVLRDGGILSSQDDFRTNNSVEGYILKKFIRSGYTTIWSFIAKLRGFTKLCIVIIVNRQMVKFNQVKRSGV
uniref:PABS domain-containing protein n=1 Tax=Acrobeloides nanus TaxID=290746 RepID=A0A914CNN7_9BILA